MEEEAFSERLTNEQIDLAKEIGNSKMMNIAYKYFKLTEGTLDNIKLNNPNNAEAQSREMIRRWANMNSEHQIQVRLIIIHDDCMLSCSSRILQAEMVYKILFPSTSIELLVTSEISQIVITILGDTTTEVFQVISSSICLLDMKKLKYPTEI